jgi:putative transposase
VLQGSAEEHRAEFNNGTREGRILGDDRFSEDALQKAAEKFIPAIDLQQVVEAVGTAYGLKGKDLAASGKARPASEARAVAALLVQDIDTLTLAALGRYLRRDLSSLSQAAKRIRTRAAKNRVLREKITRIESKLYQR